MYIYESWRIGLMLHVKNGTVQMNTSKCIEQKFPYVSIILCSIFFSVDTVSLRGAVSNVPHACTVPGRYMDQHAAHKNTQNSLMLIMHPFPQTFVKHQQINIK